MTLPAPAGPFPVGTVELVMTDSTRPAHLHADAAGRRLNLKVWYPARAIGHEDGAGDEPERVWPELRRDRRTPALARLALTLLRSRTAARPGAASARLEPALRPAVYHHGLVSFASENASLLESLASHGRLVVAIAHDAQLSELQWLQRAQPSSERQRAAVLARQLSRAAPQARAALAADYYRASTNTGRIVRERAADTAHLLHHWNRLLAAIPGPDPAHAAGAPPSLAPAAGVHLLGFSLGGAVATAAALAGAPARSVVNLDGGTQGPVDATALRAPCLMHYSAANEGINDELLPTHAVRETAPDTRHLNFHDLAGLVPALRFTPVLGSVDPVAFLARRNLRVESFLRLHDA